MTPSQLINKIKSAEVGSSKKRITICGHFAKGYKLADGQTVKTQIVVQAVRELYGTEFVKVCDTYKWQHNPFKLLIRILSTARNSTDIILLPSGNGIHVLIPFYYAISKLHKTNLHYSVIGGWLPELLANHKYLIKYLRKYKTIQVETKQMERTLKKFKLDNVHVVPNFKTIKPLSTYEIEKISYSTPLPLCTFSRVTKDKGISDAIEVVSRINAENDAPVYSLHIYGRISDDYLDEFELMLKKNTPYIEYKGSIDSNKSVGIIKNYYLLLFPTLYSTEGLPGTIIDSFAAGVPSISSRWNSFDDIIDEGVTGFGYDMCNTQQLYELLINLRDKDLVLPLKSNCIKAFSNYSFDEGCRLLQKCMERKAC